MTNRIAMLDVQSSQIHSIGHDAVTNTLAIRFFHGFGREQKPGSLYHYANFTTEDFEKFRTAESLGKHFGNYIRPFADKYHFEKIVEDVQSDDVQPTAA